MQGNGSQQEHIPTSRGKQLLLEGHQKHDGPYQLLEPSEGAGAGFEGFIDGADRAPSRSREQQETL